MSDRSETTQLLAEERRFSVIEIKVKPRTFLLKVLSEDWDSWDESERLHFCEESAGEFDKLHFGYEFVRKEA